MKKNRNGSSDLDPKAEALFRMLIDEYDRVIDYPAGTERFDISPKGDILAYVPKQGFFNRLLGRETEQPLWFFDVCRNIKEAMLRDPSIRNENAKKKLNERLMKAFNDYDKNSLIYWLFAVTLNLSGEKDNKDNNNNQNKDGNGNNNGKNNNNNNQKQNPPKKDRSQQDGSDCNNFGRIAVPFMKVPYSHRPSQQYPVKSPYDRRRQLPDYLILPEGYIYNNRYDDDEEIIDIFIEEVKE